MKHWDMNITAISTSRLRGSGRKEAERDKSWMSKSMLFIIKAAYPDLIYPRMIDNQKVIHNDSLATTELHLKQSRPYNPDPCP